MISKLVERQLASLEVAKVKGYDPASGEYFIPRYGSSALSIGKRYAISVSDRCVGDGTLSSNWNGGRAVPKRMDAVVVGKMGDMLRLGVKGETLWVNEKDIEEVMEIDGRE